MFESSSKQTSPPTSSNLIDAAACSMAPLLNTTPTITETHKKSENKEKEEASTTELNNLDPPEPEIGFVQQVQSWSTSMKRSVYDFMSKNITKQNTYDVLEFLLLFIISLASGSMYLLRYSENFTLRFMREASRLIQVLSPIIIKIFDLVSNIIGCIFILLKMMWGTLFPHRGYVQSANPMLQSEQSPPENQV